jgi:hypothetical protein
MLELLELEALVFHERHAGHAEEDVGGGSSQEHAAHNVANVIDAAAPGQVCGHQDSEKGDLELAGQDGSEQHDIEVLEFR